MSQRKLKGKIIIPSNGGGPPITVDLTHNEVKELKSVECPACDSKIFQPCSWLKKFPAVHPKNIASQNKLIPVSLYYCLKCGQEFGKDEVEKCFE